MASDSKRQREDANPGDTPPPKRARTPLPSRPPPFPPTPNQNPEDLRFSKLDVRFIYEGQTSGIQDRELFSAMVDEKIALYTLPRITYRGDQEEYVEVRL